MTEDTMITVCVVLIVASAFPFLVHGYHCYSRGQQDALWGDPLFQAYKPNDPLWIRLPFLFWDWCERKGYERESA
jgi:hypothetical protein